MRITVAGHPGVPDVDLEVPDDVPLAALRPHLAPATGRRELAAVAGRSPLPLAVDDVVLGDDQLTGQPPLVAGCVLRVGPGTRDPDRAALRSGWHLAVVAGPDAGALVALDGPVVIGRTGAVARRGRGPARLALADPAVSAEQVRVDVARGPVVTELGSRNGTVLVRRGRARLLRNRWAVTRDRVGARGGARLGRRPGGRARRLRDGDRLVLGRTTIEVRAAASPGAVTGAGGRDARGAVPPGAGFGFGAGAGADDPGTGGARPQRAPALGAGAVPTLVAPAAGALVLAAATGNPMLLGLAVVGPLTALLTSTAARSSGRADRWRARRPGTGRRGHRGPGDVVLPNPADLRTWAVRAVDEAARGPVVEGRTGHPSRGAPRLRSGHLGVLAADGGVAVVGPRGAALGVARLLVCDELAAHHPRAPDVLRLQVLPAAGDPDAWSWCRWVDPEEPGPPSRGAPTPDRPRGLLVVDGLRGPPDRSRGGGGRAEAAARAASSGDAVLVVESDPGRVPAWCTTVLHVPDDAPTVVVSHASRPAAGVPLRGVSPAWAERQARLLTALHHRAGRAASGAGGGAVPEVVALADLPGIPAPDPDAVLRRWGSGTGLRATLGAGPGGAEVEVDLVRDGPHGLVAGTTGAGKSELLQTWVLALALTHSPADLAVLLVDYKGGAGLGACAGLPHVVGQVTDLDPASASRALTGLRAELRRRERLLAEHCVPDLVTLRTRAPGAAPPRLLVVVDEFRALVDDLPGFVPGLLRVAAQGRSLGVHLLLATQRPGGAVGPDLRANLGVRIALRVMDAAESVDVLDVPDAATIPHRLVGRALVRRGSAAPEVVQVAHAGTAARPRTVGVRRVPAGVTLAVGPAAAPAAASPTRDAPAGEGTAARWVAAACAAAQRQGLPRPQPPWLPPLPDHLTAEALTEVTAPAVDGLPFALADLPAEQRRAVVTWRPAHGPLVMLGTAASGRTGVLRILAAAALDRGWHVHVVTSGAEVLDVRPGHPGAGTTVGVDDPLRLTRLLQRLTTTTGGPPRLLLVDGVEAALAALGAVARGRGAGLLLDLLRDGRRHGVSVAVTAGPGVPQGLAGRFTDRLVLAVGDAVADAVAGVPAALSGGRRGPGRGVWLPGGAHPDAPPGAPAHGTHTADGSGAALCQVALPGAPPARRRVPRVATDAARPPTRLAAVPAAVTSAGLDRAIGDAAAQGGGAPGTAGDDVPVGLGGDDAGVVRLPVGRGALVVGPPGTGRSTVLAEVARRLLDDGRRVVLVARDGPVRRLGDLRAPTRTCGHSRTALDRALDDALRPDEADVTAPGRPVVVVDDLDLLEQLTPGGSQRLADLTNPGPDDDTAPRVAVVASVTTGAATVAFRGLVATLRAGRCGVVLDPGEPGSGEAFGVDLSWVTDPARRHVPGSGAVVRGRDVVPLQVAY